MVAPLSFGAYVLGLGVAGISVALAILVGPIDAFAAAMIGGPLLLAIAGALGLRRSLGPARRPATVLALAVGAAWVAATVAVVVMLVPPAR